jgi:glyoxylase-like metal-dependent hydrolase (beta-lactamase superfamily II)
MIWKLLKLLTTLAIFFPIIVSEHGDCQAVYNYRAKLQPPPLEIVKLDERLYLAKGEWGSNVGFFVGDDGVFVIDAKATEQGTRRVIDEISKITRKPITKIVFTHSDSDSVNGYGAYPRTAELIMSMKSLEELSAGLETYLEMNAPIDIYASGGELKLQPALSFDGQLNIRAGSTRVELLQFGRAHTSGDTVVCFPDKGVAFVGDLVFVDNDPLVQDRKNGSTFGLVTSLSILLNKRPPIRTFVPSHADPLGPDKLKMIVNWMEEIQAKVATLVDAGKTYDEVKKAFGLREPPEANGAWVWPPFALKVYLELAKRKNIENLKTIKHEN